MRIQSINPNNYSNSTCKKGTGQSPKFKANIHWVVRECCHKGDLCEAALLKLIPKFVQTAIDSGKIRPENMEDLYVSRGTNNYFELLIVDKTTSFNKELSSVEDPESRGQLLKLAPFDSETEELEMSVKGKDICSENMKK